MKVLLANPPCKFSIDNKYEKYFIRAGSRWPHSGIKRKGELPHYLPFPFFLAYAAALLEHDGLEGEVIDGVALDISQEVFLEMVLNKKPDVILFESSIPTINQDLKMVRLIKENISSTIVLSGLYATTFGLDLLNKSDNVDFAIRGEYEWTFLELVRALRDKFSIEDLKGIVYRKNGKVVIAPDASLIDPLDNLPPPARHLFPQNENPNPCIYWDGFCQYRPAIQMHATRGCPYRCNFCVWNQVMYRNGKYRKFSAKRVVDEMCEVVNRYGTKEIYFDDDDFTISKSNVLAICKEIKNRNFQIKWSCMGDAINLDEETLLEMASSGCVGMKFGVETGSPQLLKTLGKPVNMKRIRNLTRWCSRYHIKSHATFTLGLLGETEQTLMETLNFAKSLDVDTIQVSICTPYPGTRLFDIVKEKGFLKSFNWEDFDGKFKGVVEYPGLHFSRIEEFHQKMMREWVLYKMFTPLWVLRQIFNFFRRIKGLGLSFIIRQLSGIIRDDFLRREK